MKRSSVTFVCMIFCFVVLALQETSSTVVQTCVPKVIDSCNLLLYQVVLSFCVIVFYFALSPRMSLF